MHLIRKLISSHSKLNAKPSLQRDLATFRILHVIDNYPPNMHSILFVWYPWLLYITHPHIYKCTCHWSNLLVHIQMSTFSRQTWYLSRDTTNQHFRKRVSCEITWDTKYHHFLGPPLRISDSRWALQAGRIRYWKPQRPKWTNWTGPTIPPARPCRP